MEHIVLKIEYLDHEKIILTNIRGDTYSSKSEELKDFLHNKPIKESEQDELWDDIEEIFDSHTAPTGGGYEADYTDRGGFISECKKKYHLIKK